MVVCSVSRVRVASTFLAASGLIWPALGMAPPAFAQTGPPSGSPADASPGEREQEPLSANVEPSGGAEGFWERDHLLGDLGGLRSQVEAAGIKLGLQEQSEVLGNPTGGVHQGAIYEGATQMTLTLDLEKLVGLPGGTFFASAYQIHGRGLSADNLHNLNVVSGIEAQRTTRLFELWYEQSLFGDKASVRIGQMAADQEFITTQYGGLFINSGFGWPTLAASDLLEGGPAYPLATPGVRFKVQPTEAVTALLGVFNGNPLDNGSGTSFRVDQGVFVIGELQYSINQGDGATGLPGTYKIGAWYNSNAFPDQFLASDGLPLADPASSGQPRMRWNNWSIYAVADQLVYRVAGTKDQGLGVFARLMGAPGDRNLLNFFANAGVTYKGLIPGREDDTIGLAIAYAKIGGAASRFDTSSQFFSGSWVPVRRNETVLELTYQYQAAGWWTLQPDFQYVFNPGGGVAKPDGTGRIGDAAVLGLRTTIVF